MSRDTVSESNESPVHVILFLNGYMSEVFKLFLNRYLVDYKMMRLCLKVHGSLIDKGIYCL